MVAVHFLRARQETSELDYWLGLFTYNRQDASLSNRIYLLYLIVFFTIWIFVTMTFFASGGATVLQLINAADPVRAAVFLQVLMLGLWFVIGMFQALRRSPVAFSEQDAALLCQTPIDRRLVVLRWLWMPWLKSLAPFLLVAVVLGFSCAELLLPTGTYAERIVAYSGFGVQAGLVVALAHLDLFILQWIIGVLRLQQDYQPRFYGPIVFSISLIFAVSFIFLLIVPAGPLTAAAQILAFPIRAGFGAGNLPAALLVSGLIAVSLLIVLYRFSLAFNLSRAAQETQELVAQTVALHYGFTSLAQSMQTRKRLGVQRKFPRLGSLPGAGALVWKDLLQSGRSVRFQNIFDWLILFTLMFGLPFLPDLTNRAFALIYWAILLSRLSTVRLRIDLANWSLVRQLPIAHWKFLLYEQALAYLLAVALSITGLVTYAFLFGTSTVLLAALIPGIVAGVSGSAALNVIRGARSSMLLNGSMPDVSAGGVLISVLLALIPFLIAGNVPGIVGAVLSILISLLFGGAALSLAARSYGRIRA